MQSLRQHEIFELEVLEGLGKAGFLRSLVFGGGTMLRLCHDLPRYSVDLDFWFSRKTDTKKFYEELLTFFKGRYQMTDFKNKHFTILYEFRGKASDRKLKVEIRKEVLTRGIEQKIAYSKYGSAQVLVPALSLDEMAERKIRALGDRNEMRDYFDLEFLLRKGIKLKLSYEVKILLQKRIGHFKKTDYGGVLGGLLERDLRDYYMKHGFSYLLEAVKSL